ncbi:MAG: hypothetical protein HC822_11395 [Oscillochloris sp.]|nr:hypothetical protein [Oscillochloris sp.]
MKRLFILAIAGVVLGLLAATILSDSGLMPVAAQSTQPGEIWRTGIPNEGAVTYATTTGRNVHVAHKVRSFRETNDHYFIFPASSVQRTILAAEYRIINRSGSYSANATMTLEILDLAGNVQHTATAGGIDVEAAAVNAWNDFGLRATTADLVIEPGEFLVVHITLDGAQNVDDLDVELVYNIEVD